MSEEAFFKLIEKETVPTRKEQEQTPVTSEDSFFSLIENVDEISAQAQSNLNVTRDVNREQEAKNYDLSKRSGLPISVVRETSKEVENQLEQPVFTIDNPSPIKNYIGSKPLNAAMSGDDIPQLEKAQTTWEKTTRAFEEGDINAKINILIARRELLGFNPDIVNKQIDEFRQRQSELEPFEAKGFIEKVMTGTARQLPQLIMSAERGIERAPLGTLIGGGIALVAGQIPPLTALPEEAITGPLLTGGTLAGFSAGQIEGIFMQEFGSSFQEYSDIRDEKGNPLDPALVKVMAFGSAITNALLEFSSFKKLVETFPGGDKLIAKITPELVKQTVASKALRDKLITIATKAGISWTTEVRTELLQELSTVVFGELAKQIQEKTTDAEFEEFNVDLFIERMGQIAEETVYSALGFLIPGTAISTGKAVTESVISKKFHDDMNNMKPIVDETKTQQRSPDHSEEFMNNIGMASPVYISSEGIDLLYQDNTKDEADNILKKIGVNPNKARSKSAAGEDIEVTQSKLLSQLNSEDYGKISKDIKPAPSAYTQRETDQRIDEDDIENSVKLLVEENQRDQQVNDEIARIKKEGENAKLDKETIDNAPVLIKSIADRLTLEGVDPVEFLKKVKFERTTFEKLKNVFTTEKEDLPRGAVPIANESHLISLFEDADMSTVIHEVGHIALKEYVNLESIGQASESLKADLNTIRKWTGAKEGQELTRDQSEQFARGFEAYLMEGKAPTPSLRAAFERFKRWLITTYRTVKKLDVRLNKDVRSVFDRMLSANIEVESTAQSGGFTIKTIEEMNTLGLNKEDQEFARRLIDKMTAKTEDNLTKARNKGYRKNINTWRKESPIELRGENPTYNLVDNMVKDNNQINREEFIDRYGEEAIALLPDDRILADPLPEKKEQTLTPEGEMNLEIMRDEIDQGEAARRIPKLDEEGNIIGFTVTGGTFPEYFKGKGLTKKETLNIIDKTLAGKKLTGKQQFILEDLTEAYRDQVARQLGVSPDEIFEESIFRTVIGGGKPIDKVSAFYEFDDFIDMFNDFFETQNLNDAVTQRINQKQAEHDAQFRAEDFIVDLKEYRDYLDIISRHIDNKGVDQARIDASIQRNMTRWEREAANEISTEQPDLTGAEREREIGFRVQEKIENFQRRKARPSTISTDALKALAKETMNAKSISEARRTDKFLGAIKKATSNERRAILRGDWGEASKQNELARFNYEMASLSAKVREEVDTIIKRAKRIGKPKKVENVDATHKEAILHLINRYNLASLAPNEPSIRPDFNSLFAGNIKEGRDDPGFDFANDGFPIPDFFTINSIRDFRDLSMEQLRDLDNAIRYLDKVGRKDRKEFLSDGVTRLEDTVNESTDVMDKVKRLKVWEKGSLMRRLTDRTRKFFSRLDSLNFIARSLDGYTNLGKEGIKGPVERFVIDKIKASENNASLEWKRIRDELKPHLVRIDKTIRKWHKQFGNNIRIEGAPVPALLREDGQTKGWKSDQIFAVVLNTGNTGDTSNFNNLLAGYPDLTPPMIENIKNMLSVEDMDAVQGIWDVMESLFPKANEQHLKMKNYVMPKVEATPFIFKGKRYKGGYYPIRHDRNLSYIVDDRGKAEDLFNSDEAQFLVPYTKSGHTIKRIRGVALPILLNLSPVDTHFRDVVQYIHYSDAIRDADKITRDPDFRRAATRILGKEVYDTIRPALKHIANPKRPGLDIPGGRAIEWMRSLSTAYTLAWNVGVAIKQPLSTYGAVRDMGIRAYLDGFSSVLMAPSVHYQKMLELSTYMRNRLSAFDRELKSEFVKLTKAQRGIYFGDSKVTWQDVKNFGYWPIRLADTGTVMPIWHGAFNDKLNADQSNLDEAIRYADDIVRNSQPSAAPLDLSSWQRDGGVFRLLSQFQTFTVGKYGQRQRMFYRAWRNGSISTMEYAWFNFMDAMLPLVTINLLQALLWGEDISDDEVLEEKMRNIGFGWLTMGVPLASNVIRMIDGYGDPIDSPVFETANKAIRGSVAAAKALDGFKNKKEREQALWGLGHTLSILSGVPVSKIVQRAEKGAKAKEAAPGIRYLVPPPKKK